MNITTDTVFQRSPSATHQSVAGEAIVIDLSTGSYYSLNETGTWLWENLDGQRSIANLAVNLAIACGVSQQVDMVQSDLTELVERLMNEGLVVAVQLDI